MSKSTLMVACLLMLGLPVTGIAQTCQTSSIPATTPTNQFTNHGDGTVTDTKTGLMWKKCNEGKVWDSETGGCNGHSAYYQWKAALERAQTVNTTGGFAGQTDWRIPNINELRSITERQCYNPAINLAVFPVMEEYSVYWSSSPDFKDIDVGGAWAIYLYSGDVARYVNENNMFVRLVRSDQ
jgi:hypothetical protein